MFKTFNKRSGISRENEKPSPGDKPVNAFVLDFGYSKLFRISSFEFVIVFILGVLCVFARVIFFPIMWCGLTDELGGVSRGSGCGALNKTSQN